MTDDNRAILVVGAGFAGAVYARTLAEAGLQVHVIDKRGHIAGNCYDEVHETGVRYHCYGPHLFHTSMDHVVDWITRFGAFTPYAHSVSVLMSDARCVPLPINVDTLNAVFSQKLETEEQAAAFVDGLASKEVSEKNAAEYLASRLGETLTDIFFRPYTKKMWAMDLEDIDAAVVKRIPIRFTKESRYFPNDTFQALPTAGYTALFTNILDHDGITVSCSTAFDKAMMKNYRFTFNSMPIDEFYDFRFGPLPYRSIRFHHQSVADAVDAGPTSVVNYSDDSKFTRRTDWSKFPDHRVVDTGRKLLTQEEPCDYKDNNFERYYPVRSSDGLNGSIAKRYQALSQEAGDIAFIGRCGTYQYLDMHQVINQSLQGARNWLAARACSGGSDQAAMERRFSA